MGIYADCQYFRHRALVPISIMKQRTIGFGCVATCSMYMTITVLIYFLPFYFQAARDLSPTTSGLYILALGGPDALASIASGAFISATKHYIPILLLSGALLSVGAGLLSTLGTSSSLGEIIGYQVMASLGLGLGAQVPLTAIRNVLGEWDVPIGNALNLFCSSLGIVIMLSIAQAVFNVTLTRRLESRLSEDSARKIIELGASNVNVANIGPDLLPFVAEAYREAVSTTIYLSIASGGIVLVAGLLMEWRKLETQASENRPASHHDEHPGQA